MANQISRANGVRSRGGNIAAGEIVFVEHDAQRNFLTITNDGTENLKVFFGYSTDEIAAQDAEGNYMLLKGVQGGSQPGENIFNPYPVPVSTIHLIPETVGADFKASVITDSRLKLLPYQP